LLEGLYENRIGFEKIGGRVLYIFHYQKVAY
jgi:hypothetical protein